MLIHAAAVRILGGRVLLAVLLGIRVPRVIGSVFKQTVGWRSTVQGSW